MASSPRAFRCSARRRLQAAGSGGGGTVSCTSCLGRGAGCAAVLACRCAGASKAGRAHRRLASCSWGRCFCASKWWRTTSSSDRVMAGPISWGGTQCFLDVKGTAGRGQRARACCCACCCAPVANLQAAPLLPHTPAFSSCGRALAAQQDSRRIAGQGLHVFVVHLRTRLIGRGFPARRQGQGGLYGAAAGCWLRGASNCTPVRLAWLGTVCRRRATGRHRSSRSSVPGGALCQH